MLLDIICPIWPLAVARYGVLYYFLSAVLLVLIVIIIIKVLSACSWDIHFAIYRKEFDVAVYQNFNFFLSFLFEINFFTPSSVAWFSILCGMGLAEIPGCRRSFCVEKKSFFLFNLRRFCC